MAERKSYGRWLTIFGGIAALVLILLVLVPRLSQDRDDGVASVPAASSAADLDDLDVLKVIPENYTLLLENDLVRVIEARIPPGTEEPLHRHLRGVSIAMGDYVIEHLSADGEWVRHRRELGTVYYSEGSVHQVRNVGTTPSHTIRIELK